jgi:hypothetical protein
MLKLSKTLTKIFTMVILATVLFTSPTFASSERELPQITISEASKKALTIADLNHLEELRLAFKAWRKYAGLNVYYDHYGQELAESMRLAHSMAKKINYPKECEQVAKSMLTDFNKMRFHFVFGSNAKANSTYRRLNRYFENIYTAIEGKSPWY